jgi:hypothetical protein
MSRCSIRCAIRAASTPIQSARGSTTRRTRSRSPARASRCCSPARRSASPIRTARTPTMPSSRSASALCRLGHRAKLRAARRRLLEDQLFERARRAPRKLEILERAPRSLRRRHGHAVLRRMARGRNRQRHHHAAQGRPRFLGSLRRLYAVPLERPAARLGRSHQGSRGRHHAHGRRSHHAAGRSPGSRQRLDEHRAAAGLRAQLPRDLGLPEILPAGATEATDNDEADQAETDSAQGTSNERGNSAHRPGSALARTRALRRKSRIPDCPLAA